MDQLLNLVRREVERVLRGYPFPRLATVVDYQQGPPAAARVTIQPEGVASNWLPVASPWIGNGWGLVAPLQPGDQVLVVFPEFGRNAGVIVTRLWDQAHATPQGAQAGECWLVHQTGASIKLLASGRIQVDGTVEIDIGNLAQAVQTLCTQTLHDWVQSHTHSGVATGTGNSGAPTTTPPSNSLTSILKAN